MKHARLFIGKHLIGLGGRFVSIGKWVIGGEV